jgi:hypothetical protein
LSAGLRFFFKGETPSAAICGIIHLLQQEKCSCLTAMLPPWQAFRSDEDIVGTRVLSVSPGLFKSKLRTVGQGVEGQTNWELYLSTITLQ